MATTYGKDYVDFDMDFDKHPAHGDLTQVKKSTAINRSLKNILMTKEFHSSINIFVRGRGDLFVVCMCIEKIDVTGEFKKKSTKLVIF